MARRLTALALLLALSGTARAQLGETSALEADAAILRDRARELLHPGRPLDLVGNGQADNDFRAKSPGLEHAGSTIAIVDADENYARRLALYAGGSTYHAALAPASRSSGYRRGGARPYGAANDGAPLEVPATSDGSGGVIGAALLSALATLGMLYLFRGRRREARALPRAR